MIVFVAAYVSRCAASALCPTDDELKSALYSRVDQEIADYVADAHARNPNDTILAHPVLIRSVSNVHCGDPLPGEPTSINCSFTIERGYSIVFETAKLTRRGGKWVITDSLAVTRRTVKRKH